MDNFDLRKYLAEGKLLNEDTSLDGLKKAKPGTTVTVGKDKYVKKAENNMTVNQPTKHLWWQKNKEDKLVHSNELAKLMEGKQLNESAPGYDTRKFGEALPTLESVQAAHEAKEFTPDLEKDDLQRKAIQQMMAKEKKKSGKGRAGVRSAAEKLGMKPSHVKEDSFSGAEIDPNVDLYSNDAVDWNFEESIEKIIDELKEYQKVNPQDDLQTAINHLEYLIYA